MAHLNPVLICCFLLFHSVCLETTITLHVKILRRQHFSSVWFDFCSDLSTMFLSEYELNWCCCSFLQRQNPVEFIYVEQTSRVLNEWLNRWTQTRIKCSKNAEMWTFPWRLANLWCVKDHKQSRKVAKWTSWWDFGRWKMWVHLRNWF